MFAKITLVRMRDGIYIKCGMLTTQAQREIDKRFKAPYGPK